jgi:hypothetical protein
MKKLMLGLTAVLALAFSAPALAADATPFGGATVTDGVATLVSNTGNTATTDDFSGVSIPVPAGLTMAQITHLAAEFNVTDDDCLAGSPRFAINFGDPNKNIVVYLDPTPAVSGGCTVNTWLSTGNLVGTVEPCKVDTSQLAAGTQCTATWASAVALAGNQPITSIRLIVDSGWAFADKEQTVLVRNVKLNDKTFLVPGTTTPPTTKPNAAKLCKAQRAALGTAAFNELWHINAQSNGIGKCVSAMNKAKNASTVQKQIMNAAKACKAKGHKGAKYGACVAATDHLGATKTEAQEHKAKGKAKRN